MFLLLNGNPDYSGIINISTEVLLDMAFIWLNVVFIVIILTWLLYKPVTKYLEERKQRIKRDLSDAEIAKKSAEENRDMYLARLANINQERDEILEEARRNALLRETAIINEARDEAAKLISRATNEIQLAERSAREKVREEIVLVGSMIAERFIAQKIDDNSSEELLNQAISELQLANGGDEIWT